MSSRSALAGALRLYKSVLSPLLPPACRFHPTCSEYAAEAVELHGVARGVGLAMVRLLHCNQWGRGGFDPVPPPSPARGRSPSSRREIV